MTLTELHDLIGRYLSLKPRSGDSSVAVIVERPGSIGPTPATPVVSASAGFDWDNGSFLIKTSDPLTLLSPEDVEDIRQSVRNGGSWHAYQAHKRLQGEIDSLRAQLKTALEKQSPAEPQPSATRQIFAEWSSAYAAFKGVFDTPLSRRRDGNEFAQDARDRLRELDETMRAMAPVLQEQERPPLEQYDLEQSAEYRKGYEDGRIKGYKVGYRHAQEHATIFSTPGAPENQDSDQLNPTDGANPLVARHPHRDGFEQWLSTEQLLTATWNDARNCYQEFPAHLAFKAWCKSRPHPDHLKSIWTVASELAQRTPLAAFSELEGATHIGHRQFAHVFSRADEDTRKLTERLATALRQL